MGYFILKTVVHEAVRPNVRVALDPIMDEIMYRVEHPEPEPKTAKVKRCGEKL